MVKLTMYNDTSYRLVSFSNDILKCSDFKTIRKKNKRFYDDIDINYTSQEEIERISLSRTKSHIREICLSNSFQYFFTVTVSSEKADRFSLSEVQEKMKKICKKIKRVNTDFKYIFITEKHKDGAFHFHGMCKNIPLYENHFHYFSSKDFDELGYNSFSLILDYNACCSYITKYITKDCVKNDNNQIYFCSRGLSRGESEYFVDFDLKKIFGEDIFQNEYCQIVDYNLNKLTLKQRNDLIDAFHTSDEILQNDNNSFTNWLKLFTNIKVNVIN